MVNILLKDVGDKINDNKITVTELPIGYWTSDFKQHLENMISDKKNQIVKDYIDLLLIKQSNLQLHFKRILHELINKSHGDYNELEKILKLYTTQHK